MWTGRATTRLPLAAQTCASMCVSSVRTDLSRPSRDTRWDKTPVRVLLFVRHRYRNSRLNRCLSVFEHRGKADENILALTLCDFWFVNCCDTTTQHSVCEVCCSPRLTVKSHLFRFFSHSRCRTRWTPSSGIPLVVYWLPARMTWHWRSVFMNTRGGFGSQWSFGKQTHSCKHEQSTNSTDTRTWKLSLLFLSLWYN